MRSFNANFIAEKNKRADGPSPINLLTFNFSTPVYLSDRDVTPPGGALHSGLIKKWGFLDSSIKQTPGTGILGAIEICDLQLTIVNTESIPFSDNFTSADPPENVTVELYQWFDGLLYSEKEIFFKGIIASHPKYDEYECSITVRGIFSKYNKLIGDDLIINAADYPKADPADIGKMLPIVYGTAKQVPFRAVDNGPISTIIADITWASPGDGETLIIKKGLTFPTGPQRIQIDNEIINIASRSGNVLTLAASEARGYRGTKPDAHISGAACTGEPLERLYIISHAIKSFSGVFFDGETQFGDYTAWTGQAGDEHSDFPGKACISVANITGYILGGFGDLVGDDFIDVIEDLKFLTNTSQVITATLDNSKERGAGVSSASKGFCIGGKTAVNVHTSAIEDLIFSSETSQKISATLTDVGALENAGVYSSTKGYCLGGERYDELYTAVIQDLIFSSETSQVISATLDTAKYAGTGVNSTSKGYCMGALTAKAPYVWTAVIEDLIFSTETSQAIAATLDTAKHAGAGVSSASKGFCIGGRIGTLVFTAAIEDLIFSSETSQTINATLDTAAGGGAGVNSVSKGVCMGGRTGSSDYTAAIEDLIFSTETSQISAATLDTGKYNAAGVQNGL